MDNKKYLIKRDVDSLDEFRISLLDDISSLINNEEINSYIELCTYEIIINIIDHSILPKDLPSEIEVTVQITDSKAYIKICYNSEEFDFTKKKLPKIKNHFKEGKSRGLGIYMIKTLMDDYSYEFEDYKNSITLIKNLVN